MDELASKIKRNFCFRDDTVEALKKFLHRSTVNSKLANLSLNSLYFLYRKAKSNKLWHLGRSEYIWRKDANIAGAQEDVAVCASKGLEGNCVIMATYSNQGIIPDYVVKYVEELRKVSTFIILVADNELSSTEEIKKIENVVDVAIFGRHNTYDFGSWKRGLEYLRKNKSIAKFQSLTLVNDSVYGPFIPLSNYFASKEALDSDFWGLLDSYDTDYHILSFFLVFKREVFDSKEFNDFFESIGNSLSFHDAVYKYERTLTAKLTKKFKSGVLFKSYATNNARSYLAGNQNATVWPLSLLKDGFPFIKIKALTGAFASDLKESGTDSLSYIRDRYSDFGVVIVKDLERRGIGHEASQSFANLLFDPLAREATYAIGDSEVVSFDIFDTLLIRPFIAPTDVFLFIEYRYKREGFALERVNAEKRARKKSLEEDIQIEEIYKEIKPKFRDLINVELATEEFLLRPSEQGVKIYSDAVKAGKDIVCISDMYLPESFLMKVLRKNGFDKIRRVFVSGDVRKTKGSGSLFLHALKELRCDKNSIIHFGDNQVADCEVPRKLGLRAYRVLKYAESYLSSPSNIARRMFFMNNANIASSAHSALISQRFTAQNTHCSYWEYLGYTYGGPLALSYVSFIDKEAKKNHVDELLFISRDGFALKAVYDKFFNKDKKSIISEYGYVSRAVGLRASLDYAKDPGYLYSLLNLFYKETGKGKPTNSFETNQLLYSKYHKELKKWSSKSKQSFVSHLVKKTREAESVAVVDMTTGLFSSLRYAKWALGSKIVTGFFTGSFKENESLIFETFSNRRFDFQDDLALKLSELLISSPEKPITDILENGSPVYGQEVGIRSEIYPEILKGILSYCEDFIATYGYEEKLFFTMELWLQLAKNFCLYCNDQDLSFLEKVFDSPEIDNIKDSKNLAVRIRESRNKSQ